MVAKNHCLVKLRDKGKIPIEINEEIHGTSEDLEEVKKQLEKDQLFTSMETALQQLNREQQQCITLFYFEKKSYQEITTTTGYTLMQVKSFIQNGKRNLKLILEDVQQQDK